MQDDSTTRPTVNGEDFSKTVDQVVKTVIETARTAAAKAFENSGEHLEQGKELVNDGFQKTVAIVRKYPLESAVVCLGVGFLVGKLLSRRD